MPSSSATARARARSSVRGRHVREARAEAVVVRAHERVVAEQVDVVAQKHEVAGRPERIHPAAGIRYDERPGAERVHHPHREGHLLKVVALVAVEAALHRDHRAAAQPAQEEPAGMALDGGERKARNLRVAYGGVYGDLAREPAEARPQDEAHLRLRSRAPAHHLGGGLHPVVQ
jgi:hypothetical protein